MADKAAGDTRADGRAEAKVEARADAAASRGPRRPVVIGNWKMNGDVAGNERLLGALRVQLDRSLLDRVEVAVCPPFPYISQASTWLGDTGAGWGAQDIARTGNGAFTGEVSGAMLADLRCSWVLVGHSERRQLFGETDADVAVKVKLALDSGIRPVICVGETLEERQSNVTERVLGRQVAAVAPVLAGIAPDRYILAYEPVWAIGTGLTATPAQAQAAHAFLRDSLARGLALAPGGIDGEGFAGKVRILYGGSVKPGNALELFEQADVDGGLIGGAALVAEDFVAICKAAIPA